MKFLLFLLASTLIFYSCNNIKSESATEFKYDNTPLGTLKESYKHNMSNPTAYDARYYFLKKHKDEVLKTLEVVEEVEVQKDVVLIFYRYSIGTDIVKQTIYMRKIDGKYLPYSKYYSSYEDDPFKNGKPDEGKALLKKAEEWEKNENIWWAL
ncbi:MAG: hypothetical protein ACR2KB_13275 [Chitinophagaceae bacterium]